MFLKDFENKYSIFNMSLTWAKQKNPSMFSTIKLNSMHSQLDKIFLENHVLILFLFQHKSLFLKTL